MDCEESGKADDGHQCDACGGRGYVEIQGCPRKSVGWEMTQAINLASYASKGFLPVAGGILDQSAWFVDVWTTLDGEQNKIDAEMAERRNRGKRY